MFDFIGCVGVWQPNCIKVDGSAVIDCQVRHALPGDEIRCAGAWRQRPTKETVSGSDRFRGRDDKFNIISCSIGCRCGGTAVGVVYDRIDNRVPFGIKIRAFGIHGETRAVIKGFCTERGICPPQEDIAQPGESVCVQVRGLTERQVLRRHGPGHSGCVGIETDGVRTGIPRGVKCLVFRCAHGIYRAVRISDNTRISIGLCGRPSSEGFTDHRKVVRSEGCA